MGFLKFLGTAGARFVMIKQLRSSGGLWLNWGLTNLIIDPGPAALVRALFSKPKLDPSKLDGIILTHKHLDHCSDINVMIEAMTDGGFNKRGKVFVPSDAVGSDGVIFSYLTNYPEEIVFLKEKSYFSIGDIKFFVPIRNLHPVETYGLKFYIGNQVISIVSDTEYFEDLIQAYEDSTILILNVVFYEKKKDIQHLSLNEALDLAKQIRPNLTILTHFGMSMLKAKPSELEKKLAKGFPFELKFAYDGLTIQI